MTAAAAAAIPPIDTLQRRELAEGVEVELRPAGPMVRAAAWLMDMVWLVLIFIGVSIVLRLVGMVVSPAIMGGIWLVVLFALFWGYQVYFEAGKKAATPGKRLMRIRVVSESGGPASPGAIMLRNLARVADGMPGLMFPIFEFLGFPFPCYFAGLLVCLFTRRFQRLGDLVARTLVVYADPDTIPPAKSPPPLPGLKPHPPRVALTREERSAVVRFDERAPLWSPARREELAGHAAGLTQTKGLQGVQELALMASWLRDS